jgi:hypothetical protein
MLRIAIVGSRKYPRLHLIPHLLLGIIPPRSRIVTGDARGVDAKVIETTTLLALNPASGHTLDVHQANWAHHQKQAGPIRNSAILAACDILIAFWDLKSKGTEDITTQAYRLGIPVHIYGPDGKLLPDQPSLFEPIQTIYLPDLSDIPAPPLGIYNEQPVSV